VVERYEALEALHKEMKAKERVEALYAQGAKEEAAAAAAAAGEDVDEAKIQDEEDAGEGVVCVGGGGGAGGKRACKAGGGWRECGGWMRLGWTGAKGCCRCSGRLPLGQAGGAQTNKQGQGGVGRVTAQVLLQGC
jgi:hypothetical protein